MAVYYLFSTSMQAMGKDKANDNCSLDGVVSQAKQGENVAGKFNQECSLTDRKQFFDDLRSKATDSKQEAGTSMSYKLGGLEIVGDTASRKLEGIYGGGDKHGADAAAGKTAQKGDHAAAKGRTNGDAKPQAADKGTPGISDEDNRLLRAWASPDDKAKAKTIKEDLLAGKDVSETINNLPRDQKRTVMAVVKGELAESPGTKTAVSQNGDGSKDIIMTTKDGGKLLISEDFMGSPKDIVVNGMGWRTAMGSKDVYNRPGESNQTQSAGSGFNLREALLGKDKLTDGNGPLARAMRGEELSADDQKKLAELSKGGKLVVYKPRGVTD